LTEISEDVWMLSGRYERVFDRWKVALGGNVSRSEFRNDDDDTDYQAFLEVEYLLF